MYINVCMYICKKERLRQRAPSYEIFQAKEIRNEVHICRYLIEMHQNNDT
jgi:hypothetical protein